MKIDIMTLFPAMVDTVLCESIIGRARKRNLIDIKCWDIRDYTLDKQKRVDDAPYGGGMGMVMQAEPIYRCYTQIILQRGDAHVIYLSPQGTVFSQRKAIELSQKDHVILLCGHYEGVDERILEEIVDEEISIGDYVLTGGEIAATVVADAVSRLVPGVLSDDSCFELESHYDGLLEHAHYSRPAVWRGREVPEILLSGHHENIKEYRHLQSLERTADKRPDMIETANLTENDVNFINERSKKP